MTKIRNWVNRDLETDSSAEMPNKLPSMTVPDMSLTVKELVERVNMGLPPEGERVPIFDEGDPFPDISRMDLVDRQNFIQHYQQKINELLTPKDATDAAMRELQNDKLETQVLEDAYKDKILKD